MHPSDTAPALIALGARVRIAGPGRSRRRSALVVLRRTGKTSVTRETVLEKNEIVTEILLPAAEPGLQQLVPEGAGRGGPGTSRWPASRWRS